MFLCLLARAVVIHGMTIKWWTDYFKEDTNLLIPSDSRNVVIAFGVTLGIATIHFLVLLSYTRSMAVKSWMWMIPYWVWKPIMIGGGIALLVCILINEDEYIRVSMHWKYVFGTPDINTIAVTRGYTTTTTAFPILYNTQAWQTWQSYRNEVILAPLCFGIALGIWSLAMSIIAGIWYRRMEIEGDVDITYRQSKY